MNGILCFGDSITFGRGEQPNRSWTGRLKDFFEPKGLHHGVYNLGVSGHTSTDLLKRFDAEATARVKYRPTDKFLILMAIGANDCKWDGLPQDNNPRTTKQAFTENISQLIEKAKKYNAGLAFIGLIPVDEKLTLPFEETSFENKRVKEFNDIIKTLCHQNGVLFFNMFKEMSKVDYVSFLFDGLHPNEKGYDWMFEKIKEFLIDSKLI